MALYWNWNEKCGEATLLDKHPHNDEPHEFTVSLYQGNAWLIMLHEYVEDGKEMYSMYSFWADKEHMNNVLGLSKGHKENIYDTPYVKLTRIRLDKRKCTRYADIVKALAKAFDELTIELYTSDA